MAEIDTFTDVVRAMAAYLRDTWPHSTDAATLLEALLAQRDAAVARAEKAEGERDEWLKPSPWVDTRLVRFDDSIVFSKGGFDFDRWEALRQEMHTPRGSYAVWKSGERTWSMYGTPNGILALDRYSSEFSAQVDAEQYDVSLRKSLTEIEAQLTTALARVAELEGENERMRKLVFDLYACTHVLGKDVGKICAPDGFFALWNDASFDAEQLGAVPFEKRLSSTPPRKET